MHKTALDLVPVLRAIEDVQHSPLLTPAQREAICLELHHSLPDPMFCNNGRITLHIIQTILRSKDGSTKPAEVKSPATSKEPKHGAASKQKPIRKTTPNTRGKSKAPADAGKSLQ